MMLEKTVDVVEVVAAKINGNGFQATDGTWYNVSKFAKASEAPLPAPGQRVRCVLDKSGYVRKIVPAEAPASVAPADNAPTPASRDVQIIRMNALSHAVAIVTYNAGAEKVRLADVLACAEQLETWIGR